MYSNKVSKIKWEQLSSWDVKEGKWNIRKEIVESASDNKNLLISKESMENFIFSADIVFEKNGTGAFLFGVKSEGKFGRKMDFFKIGLNFQNNSVEYYRTPIDTIRKISHKIEKHNRLKVQSLNNNLKVYVQNSLVIDIDDFFTKGKIGFSANHSKIKFDNIEIFSVNDTDKIRILKGLKLSKEEISPDFEEKIFRYHSIVNNEKNMIEVIPDICQNTDYNYLEINKKIFSVKDETSSFDFCLEEGENIIEIEEPLDENLPICTTIGVYRKKGDQYNERYRPRYHFTPARNWLNDPNGLVYYEGEYHMFYQHNPFFNEWGPMHWGHATSEDLVNWEHQPIALYPDELGTIFSGSIVVDKEDRTGFFEGDSGLVSIFTHATGFEGQMQSIAYSKDRGRNWEKYKGNPVIPNFGVEHFRDPKVFWHEETVRWIMVVGGGKVRIYSSPDLKEWRLESSNDIWTECPDLFELPLIDKEGNDKDDTKWILSAGGRKYYLGEFNGKHFSPEFGPKTMNYGPDSYASQSFSNLSSPRGGKIMLSWMANLDTAWDIPTKPWKGRMTLPLELYLVQNEDITLIQKPFIDLESHRYNKYYCSKELIESNDNHTNILPDLQTYSFNIKVKFEIREADEFGFLLFKGKDSPVRVGYNTENEEVFIDKRFCGENFDPRLFTAPMKSRRGNIKLNIFVDNSSIEVFGNEGRKLITSLVFTDTDNSIDMFVKNGDVKIDELIIEEIESIWTSS